MGKIKEIHAILLESEEVVEKLMKKEKRLKLKFILFNAIMLISSIFFSLFTTHWYPILFFIMYLFTTYYIIQKEIKETKIQQIRLEAKSLLLKSTLDESKAQPSPLFEIKGASGKKIRLMDKVKRVYTSKQCTVVFISEDQIILVTDNINNPITYTKKELL